MDTQWKGVGREKPKTKKPPALAAGTEELSALLCSASGQWRRWSVHQLKSGGAGGIEWGRVGDCALGRGHAAPALALAKSYKLKPLLSPNGFINSTSELSCRLWTMVFLMSSKLGPVARPIC